MWPHARYAPSRAKSREDEIFFHCAYLVPRPDLEFYRITVVACEQASGECQKRRDGLRSLNYFFVLARSLFAWSPLAGSLFREPVRRLCCG